MPTGALIDPAGATPELLTEDESSKLSTMLKVLRSDENEAAANMINWLIHEAAVKPGLTGEQIFKECVFQLLCNDEGEQAAVHSGVLSGGIAEPLFLLSEAEYKSLAAFVEVLRLDSWVSRWLTTQIRTIACAWHPAERCPTPLQLMSALTLDAEEFEVAAHTTRQQLRARPDLFHDLLPVVPTPAPAEPTVAESLKRAEAAPTPRKKRRRAA